MKKAYCPIINNSLCKYGGNKRYNYGFTSGMASYCRLVKAWVHDLRGVCPNHRVDCCNPDCGWTGKYDECVTIKHGSEPLCPKCHEVTEPVQD